MRSSMFAVGTLFFVVCAGFADAETADNGFPVVKTVWQEFQEQLSARVTVIGLDLDKEFETDSDWPEMDLYRYAPPDYFAIFAEIWKSNGETRLITIYKTSPEKINGENISVELSHATSCVKKFLEQVRNWHKNGLLDTPSPDSVTPEDTSFFKKLTAEVSSVAPLFVSNIWLKTERNFMAIRAEIYVDRNNQKIAAFYVSIKKSGDFFEQLQPKESKELYDYFIEDWIVKEYPMDEIRTADKKELSKKALEIISATTEFLEEKPYLDVED